MLDSALNRIPVPNPATGVPVELVLNVSASTAVPVFAFTLVDVNAPPVVAPFATVSLVTLLVSKLSALLSFVPMVTAAPVVLPPLSMSPPEVLLMVILVGVPTKVVLVPPIRSMSVPVLLLTVRGEAVPLTSRFVPPAPAGG